jgi:hypothetical protein
MTALRRDLASIKSFRSPIFMAGLIGIGLRSPNGPTVYKKFS